MSSLHRIVLTGGPCGGKTTAMARLFERLQALGFRVFIVPEAATMLISGGVSFRDVSMQQLFALETALLRAQIALEDAFVHAAEACGQPAVILYDRGTLDVSAYLPPELWQALLDENQWTTVGLRDRRYEAVLHLTTAADGAEAFYTTANNTARHETPEQARALDRRLQDAWVGHPHLRVIDNSTDFNGKVQRVLQAVSQLVGVPEPVEIERKFLLLRPPASIPVRHEEVEIEQVYLLTSDGSEARVRRRSQRGNSSYTHTVKRPVAAGQRVEIERPISAREYIALLAQANPSRRPVRKRRTCFLWERQYFELDVFESPCAGLVLLEVELDDPTRDVNLPPFVDVKQEVTEDKGFSNFALSAKP